MRCREATRLIVRHLTQAEAAGASYELAEHLRLCPDCARRLEDYWRARDELRALAPAEPPEELHEIMAQGLREALAKPMELDSPPADPTPETSGQKKGAIVVVGLIGVLAAAMLVGLMFAREGALPAAGAEVVLSAGDAQITPPGTANWRPLGRREPLPPGTQLRTGPGGLVQVRDGPVVWSMPALSRMAFADEHRAELVVGRAYVECAGGADGPSELVTGDGTVTCHRGAFMAARSLKRLRVGCISGSVVAGVGEQSVELGPGQVAVLAEGRLCGPVRSARSAELAHLLRAFDSYEGTHLSPRQLAAVPLRPEGSVLPPTVAVSVLEIGVVMRGPIALVDVAIVLRNDGQAAWQGALALGDALLPPPLVETPKAELVLEPGGQVVQRLSALCVLREREGFFALGLLPEVWTRTEIEHLKVDVRASADGGIRRFSCPTLGGRLRKPGEVTWAWQGRRVAPETPIVLECELAEGDSADCLALRSEHGAHAVVAWRPELAREEWIKKGRNVFVAFDAAADFGPGGIVAAQEVLEVLLYALPPACSTALLAYDGTLKLEPGRLTAHLPERVEAMLTALWALRDDGEPRTADFLHEALSGADAAQGEALVVFVTGRQAPERLAGSEEVLRDSDVRLCVLQVGAERAAPAYRSLAAASGGVALAVPSRLAAEFGALDLLVNFRWPAVRSAAVEPTGEGEGTVLLGPGDFANQPVVALVSLPDGASACRARLSAQVGAETRSRDVVFEPAGGMFVAGDAAQRLSRALHGGS